MENQLEPESNDGIIVDKQVIFQGTKRIELVNETSHAIIEFSKAFSAAQKCFGKAHLNSINPHFRAKYANLEAVIDAVRQPLGDNGLAFMQFPCVSEVIKNGKPITEVTVVTRILHQSGEWVQCTLTLTSGEVGVQKVGSLISYARRYSLTAALGISNGEGDDDGNLADGKPEAKQEPKPTEKRQPPKQKEQNALEQKAQEVFASPDVDLINKAKSNLRQLGIQNAQDAAAAVRQLCPEFVFEGAVPWERLSPEQLRDLASAQSEEPVTVSEETRKSQ